MACANKEEKLVRLINETWNMDCNLTKKISIAVQPSRLVAILIFPL